VYTFYEPEARTSTTYNVMCKWNRPFAQLRHLYLGYWIRESNKMAYRPNFKPHELLSTTVGASQRLNRRPAPAGLAHAPGVLALLRSRLPRSAPARQTTRALDGLPARRRWRRPAAPSHGVTLQETDVTARSPGRAKHNRLIVYWGAACARRGNQLTATLFNRQSHRAHACLRAGVRRWDSPGAQKLGARFKSTATRRSCCSVRKALN